MKKSGSKSKSLLSRGVLVVCCILMMVWSTGLVGTAAQQGRTVRVGYFPMTGFHEYDPSGRPWGYDMDYLREIAQKTNWNYEMVAVENWQEALQLLKDKKLDLLAPAQITPERQREFAFSTYSIGTEYGALLTLDTNEKLVFEDFDGFSQVKIGIVPTAIIVDSFAAYAAENKFTPHMVQYKDTTALMSALNAGEVDVVVANLMTVKKNMKLLGKFGAAPFYYMYQKENFALGQELNYALSKIKVEEPNFENALLAKYYPIYTSMPMTKDELAYIKQVRTLTIGCPPDRDPISYVDEKTGEIQGINQRILEEIAKESGLKFRYTMLPSGDISYAYLREHHIDMVSGAEYNEANKEAPGVKISVPYLTSQKVLVMKEGYEFQTKEQATVGIVAGSQTLETIIHGKYPYFQIKKFQTMQECMDGVKNGHVDMMIQNQYAVQRFLAKPKYEELTIIPLEGIADQLCLAPLFYKDPNGAVDPWLSDPRLLSVINKTISQMPDQRVSSFVVEETINRPYRFTLGDSLYRYRYPLLVVVTILLLTAMVMAYAMRLRKKNLEIARASESKLQSIANNINGGVVVLVPNAGLRITYANEGFLNLIRCGGDQYGQEWDHDYMTYVHGEDIPVLNALVTMNDQQETQLSVRLRIRRMDGTYVPTLFNGTLAVTATGEKELYCVIMDITEEIRMLEELELQQSRHELLMEKSDEMVFDVDLHKRELTMSEKFKDKFGWSLPQKMEGATMRQMLDAWHIHREDKKTFVDSVEEELRRSGESECTVRVLQTDGGCRWCRIVHYTMKLHGKSAFIAGKVIDIDESMKEKQFLLTKSREDALTGLLNKEAFIQEGQAYLDEHPQQLSAVIFMDLDHFKSVNDSLGHLTGDEAIKEAARKLQTVFSHFDLLARFGGDEFCVLVKDIPWNTLQDKLAWLIEKMRSTYTDGAREVRVTTSVGVACTPDCGARMETLMDCADRALYRAKEQGRDQVVLYHR